MKMLEYKPLTGVYGDVSDRYGYLCREVAQKMGLTIQSYLGKGSYASAYLLSDGRVIKITRDVHDFNMAVTIMEHVEKTKVQPRHIVKIHDAFYLSKSNLFIIITDKVELDREKYFNELSSAHSYYQHLIHTGQWEDDEWFDDIGVDDIEKTIIKSMASEFLKLGFTSVDLHEDNVGFVNCVPVLFDFGHHSSDSLSVKKVMKILKF